jgi:hypothetical protein
MCTFKNNGNLIILLYTPKKVRPINKKHIKVAYSPNSSNTSTHGSYTNRKREAKQTEEK